MRCFESVISPLHGIKMNCTITFCYWCSLEYVDDPIAVRDILGPMYDEVRSSFVLFQVHATVCSSMM